MEDQYQHLTMITEEELRSHAQQRHLRLYQQEKEYLMYLFLYSLSKYNGFVFKGGTALRIAYKHERFSEYLDFNSTHKPVHIQTQIQNSIAVYHQVGIEVGFLKEELFQNSYTATLRLKGPLFKGRPDSVNKIRLDIGNRKTYLPKTVFIPKLFSDVPEFFLDCMSEEEILVEKIRSLYQRHKARDLYDAFILVHIYSSPKKWKTDFVKKCKEEGVVCKGQPSFISSKSFENEMKLLVDKVPSYDIVVEKVGSWIRELVA